jgi:hypothetical protein
VFLWRNAFLKLLFALHVQPKSRANFINIVVDNVPPEQEPNYSSWQNRQPPFDPVRPNFLSNTKIFGPPRKFRETAMSHFSVIGATYKVPILEVSGRKKSFSFRRFLMNVGPSCSCFPIEHYTFKVNHPITRLFITSPMGDSLCRSLNGLKTEIATSACLFQNQYPPRRLTRV